MDQSTKPWWQSTGVWGSLVAIVAGLAGYVGYAITPDDQLVMIDTAIKAASLVTDTAALGGGLIALFGRIRATKVIG